jgi:hypothetical protein
MKYRRRKCHITHNYFSYLIGHHSPTITKRHQNIPGIGCVCNGIQIACGVVASNTRQWSKCISVSNTYVYSSGEWIEI